MSDELNGFKPKIESGVNIPEIKRGAQSSKYDGLMKLAFEMKPNQSFAVPLPVRKGGVLKSKLEKKHPGALWTVRSELFSDAQTKEVTEGFRIWRVK